MGALNNTLWNLLRANEHLQAAGECARAEGIACVELGRALGRALHDVALAKRAAIGRKAQKIAAGEIPMSPEGRDACARFREQLDKMKKISGEDMDTILRESKVEEQKGDDS